MSEISNILRRCERRRTEKLKMFKVLIKIIVIAEDYYDTKRTNGKGNDI